MGDEQHYELTVQATRFVDAHQPGWIACEFADVDGIRHTLVDKVPIFTADYLDGDSAYPVAVVAPCVVVARWQDTVGRELVRISTERPCCIESTVGLTEFVVLPSQLTAVGPAA